MVFRGVDEYVWWPMAATWISTKKNEKPIQNKMETDFKVKVKWKWNQFQSKIKPKPI